jgi:hypothetical protein
MALHQLRTADIEDLVTLRLSGTPVAQREKRGPAQPRCWRCYGSNPTEQYADPTEQYAEIFAARGNPTKDTLTRGL